MTEANPTPETSNEATTPEAPATEAPKTGPVVGSTEKAGGELSSGQTAGIGVGIGVLNVCCGPNCGCMPTMLGTVIGAVLYFMWKEEKPNTAKTILTVTLVTAGIGILFFGIGMALGLAGEMFQAASYDFR